MPDLLRKAKKLESEELTNIKFTPERVSSLDDLLLDAYAKQCPKPIDYYNRRDLVRIFNVIAKEVYGNLLFQIQSSVELILFAHLHR